MNVKVNTVLLLIKLVFEIESAYIRKDWVLNGNDLLIVYPCKRNENISILYESGQPPEEENKYVLRINQEVPQYTNVNVKFDTDSVVTLMNSTNARISAGQDSLNIRFFKPGQVPALIVKGPATGALPYLTSVMVNSVEYCEQPKSGYLDDLIEGYRNTAETRLSVPDESCGRRQVTHTELIVNGLETQPGDWPWHAALYRLELTGIKYICGGTLLAKLFVITAAHCTTLRGVPVLPEIMSVVLGKHKLIGGDIAAQERQIYEIIVHENFNTTNLNHDISLLKLKTEAVFDNYVQPACMWHSDDYKRLGTVQVYGTVVGWGFDQTDKLSSQLRQTTMPKVSESKCLKSNPVFFARMLNENKFCGGYNNGTSACNGDSGGGFMVFVPDIPGNMFANATGAWHIRGIVSVGVSRRDVKVCDPTQYVLFTDLAKYKGWIGNNMKQH